MLYSAFGLTLKTNRDIPGLIRSPVNDADVQIIMGEFPDWFRDHSSAQLYFQNKKVDSNGAALLTVWKLKENYFHFRYSDNIEFLVNESNVFARWPASLTLEDTVVYLLGPILAFVLLLRGIVTLHASAIAIDNYAIALIGPAGSGKSTTAAGFAQKGFSVLSDDVTILDDRGNEFYVTPTYPRIRLWPSSVGNLCGSEDALPLLTPTWDKRFLDLTTNDKFEADSLPLKALYFFADRVGEDDRPKIISCSAPEGLTGLVSNAYVTYLKDRNKRSQEFQLLNKLIAKVPVRSVLPHSDPRYLDRLCDVLIQDFRQMELVGNV
ncbi:MAG TPA: hypothetical protein VFH91_09180 [Pyrinomonadaceae bacterium]|nr:hypothetical protein [Pyrinomonadaceae bacterium]